MQLLSKLGIHKVKTSHPLFGKSPLQKLYSMDSSKGALGLSGPLSHIICVIRLGEPSTVAHPLRVNVYCVNHHDNTLPTVPSGAPRSASITSSSTSITLSIEEPLPEHKNGIITSYSVSVTQASNGRTRQATSTGSTVTVTSLTPYTLYSVNVRASTVNGTGPPSQSYEVTTLEAGEN